VLCCLFVLWRAWAKAAKWLDVCANSVISSSYDGTSCDLVSPDGGRSAGTRTHTDGPTCFVVDAGVNTSTMPSEVVLEKDSNGPRNSLFTSPLLRSPLSGGVEVSPRPRRSHLPRCRALQLHSIPLPPLRPTEAKQRLTVTLA